MASAECIRVTREHAAVFAGWHGPRAELGCYRLGNSVSFSGAKSSSMSTRLETGACFCGAVVAEMHGDPFWICYDHDDDCRRAIGSPLTIWVGYRPSEFRVIRGVLRSFSKTKGVIRTFCPECGTSISYLDEGL